MWRWKATILLGSALLLTSCLRTTRAAEFTGPVPTPRDVASPEGLDPDLARTRIYWGHYRHLDGTDVSLPVPEGTMIGRLSPSGRYSTSVIGFGLIEWWDLEAGERRILVDMKEAFPSAVFVDHPSFMPDERSLLFEVAWSDHSDPATVDVDTGEIEYIDAPGGGNRFPEISPDGRWILVSCEGGEPGGAWALCLINREARTKTTLTDEQGFDPRFSGQFTPDSQFVVYLTTDASLSGEGRLYRVGIDGQDKLLLVSGLNVGGGLALPPGQEVVFSCPDTDRPACSWVCVVNLDGTDVRRLTYLGEQCVDANAP